MMLASRKYEFVDKPMDTADWPSKKGTKGYESGALPLVIMNGPMGEMRLHETNAILRMLGIKLAYYDPKDADSSHWNDCIMDMGNDCLSAGFIPVAGMLPKGDMEGIIKHINEWSTGSFKKFLDLIEERMVKE